MIDAVTVTPLRQRMIEDMTIRRFGEHTQRDYVRQVREFTAFLGLPPDRAEPEDLRRYQLHMASLGASYTRMNTACTALRFFFHVTLGRIGFGDRMARIPTPDRLPVVLDTQEVALLLAHARSLKDRTALSIAYGCGLRVSEIANLKVADIDSARMLIRVEQGKGRKDRYVMLAPDLLDLLRQWWQVKRPRGWLFPGQQPGQPITTRQLNRASRTAPLGGHVMACGDCDHAIIASSRRADTIACIRKIIAAEGPNHIARDDVPVAAAQPEQAPESPPPCPCCGGRMILVERFAPGTAPRTILAVRIDTS